MMVMVGKAKRLTNNNRHHKKEKNDSMCNEDNLVSVITIGYENGNWMLMN